MKKIATLGAQIDEPFYSRVSQPEQKIPVLVGLAAHPEMRLQADRDDAFLDQLGEG